MTATEQIRAAIADRYVIERELGAGGMATVYLAQDVKHDRKVALKVLRPELAAIIGAERFLQEIKVTANLQHPHILPLFDSGEAGSFLYYVMPYVEGETLRDKLTREKQLKIDEAVRIAREAADALDYAHRQGVVHRDIKPENILLHDGRVLVADFGIALAVSQAGGGRMTETGMSLGTPHYMSPEQAMGEREITARSDVYALGCVLYEMLSGEPPFTGATAQAIVARVVTEQPRPLLPQRHTIPPHVEATVLQALEKLPADRFTTAAEFNAALSGTAKTRTTSHAIPTPAAGLRPRWHLVASLTGVLLLGALAGWGLTRSEPPPLARFTILEGDSITLGAGMDVAPDGQALVFAGVRSDGVLGIFVREVDEPSARFLLAEGQAPRFSPDGQSIVYIGGGSNAVYRTSISSPNPVLLTDSALGFGAVWGHDGYVYFNHPRGVARVATGGGPVEVVVPADSGLSMPLAWPELLADGRTIVFTRFQFNALGSMTLMAWDLRDGRQRELGTGMSARDVGDGSLVYGTPSGVLVRQRFDADELAFTGPPEPVANNLLVSAIGFSGLAVSRSGTLLYQTTPSGLTGLAHLVSVDRTGRADPLSVPPDVFNSLALSPDGSRLALEVTEGGQDGGRIMLLDLGDSVLSRLTFDGINTYPAFSADGRRVAYSRFANGERNLAWKPASGAGRAETLFERPGDEFEVTFHPDGRWMVYRGGNASAVSDLGLFARRLDGSVDTVLLDQPGVLERSPVFSPDGRWLAYVSNETGQDEVYVRPFPDDGSGAVWQVSLTGGTEPMWGHGGRELFYKSAASFVAATYRTVPAFAVVDRRSLFSVAPYINNIWHARYAVLPGDERFLMLQVGGQVNDLRTHIVLNWRQHLDD